MPTAIDLRLAKLFCDLRLCLCDRFQFLRWRNYIKLIPLRPGPEIGLGIYLRSVAYFIIGHLLTLALHNLGYPLVLRTVIIEHLIIICNVSNVPRAIDNREVLLSRNKEFSVGRPAEIADANEGECGGTDIIVTVTPGVNADVDGYRSLGR